MTKIRTVKWNLILHTCIERQHFSFFPSCLWEILKRKWSDSDQQKSNMYSAKCHSECEQLSTVFFNTRNNCEPLTQRCEILLDFTPLIRRCSWCAYWPHRWCSSGPARPWSSASAPFPCRLTPRLPSPTGTASTSAAGSTWYKKTPCQIKNKNKNPACAKDYRVKHITQTKSWKWKILRLTWSSQTACGLTLWCCVPCSRRGAPWEPWTWRSGACSTRSAPRPACTGGLKRQR